jgi:hypothetical protein
MKRIFRGLKYPKGSPEHEYAKYALMCIYGPYAISAGCCGLVILASLFISTGGSGPVSQGYEVTIQDIKTADENLKIDEVKPEVTPDVVQDDPTKAPGPENPEISTPGPVQQDYSSNPDANPNDTTVGVGGDSDTALVPLQATMTKSPMVLKGLYGNRTKGGRESALRAYGGGGGSGKADGSGHTTEDAVLRALRWLKKNQSEDGSWDAKSGGGPGDYYPGAPAFTGLALLTYLAHGETPTSQEFGPTVEKAIKWMVENQLPDGHFKNTGKDDHNYSQPIAAYSLCEAFGMTQVPMVKDAAKKAIAVLIKNQHTSGLWDYDWANTIASRNDISYSGWCIQALKSAQMAGMDNDGLNDATKKAIVGLKGNFQKGTFMYTGDPKEEGDKLGRLTCVGVLCLQLLGAGKDTEAKTGMNWLDQNATCDWTAPWGQNPIYDWYYTTQAKFHAGGDEWKQWNSQFSIQITASQKVLTGAGIDGKDIGYWEGLDVCKSYMYNTTLCTLMLEVYYRYLPTYRPPDVQKTESATSSDDIKVEVTK